LDFKPVSLSGTSTALALSQQEQVTTDTLNAAGTISHVTATGTETKLVPTLALTATIASGSSLLLTVHASGSGATPMGTVSFYSGGVLIGTSSTPLSANGNVSFTTPRPTQRHTYQAVNTGDAVYASGKSNGVVITPTTATPTVTLTLTPNPATLGQSVTFKATVSTAISGLAPTGSVKFSVSNVVVGSAVISGGVVTFSTSTMTAGAHTIAATYLGDANYLTATSNSVKETITP
jgi:hypothetical protein